MSVKGKDPKPRTFAGTSRAPPNKLLARPGPPGKAKLSYGSLWRSLLGAFWQLSGAFWKLSRLSGNLLEAFWERSGGLLEASTRFLGTFSELSGSLLGSCWEPSANLPGAFLQPFLRGFWDWDFQGTFLGTFWELLRTFWCLWDHWDTAVSGQILTRCLFGAKAEAISFFSSCD